MPVTPTQRDRHFLLSTKFAMKLKRSDELLQH